MQINLITLGVNDLKKSSDFYSNWFKIKAADASNENVVFFNFKGVKLSLFSREALAKDANIASEGSGFRGITLAINADSKQEVDQIFQLGMTAGAKNIKNPEMVFWGGYSGYVSDPDGQLWEIAWNPHFKKDINGELIIK